MVDTLRKKAFFSGVAAGFLLLAACAGHVSFPNAKLADYDTQVTEVSGLLAKPEGNGPFPAVVLLQSCGGMKSHVVSDWPPYLAGLGYVALTVDSLGARGILACQTAPQAHALKAQLVKDAYGALAYLARQPYVDADRIAVIGFSLGGFAINGTPLSWRIDNPGQPDFKAAIALYAPCRDIGMYVPEMVPLMQIVAERDDLAPLCQAVGRENPGISVHVIPAAHHAFDSVEASGRTDFAGHHMEYDGAATRKAKELAAAFLRKHFGR